MLYFDLFIILLVFFFYKYDNNIVCWAYIIDIILTISLFIIYLFML